MTSLNRYISLLVFCVVLGHGHSQNVSRAILDFLSVFNGKWGNREQIDTDNGTARSLVESRFMPVQVPLLGPNPVLYFENAIRGKVFSMYLCVVSQDKTDPKIIYLTPYTFANASNYLPGSYDIKDLRNLTRDDLELDKACAADFLAAGPAIYVGACPRCDNKVHGHHPECALAISCDSFTITSHRTTKGLGADILKLTEPRYPIANVPDNYQSPCNKTDRAWAYERHG